ncbi:hypothetical protein [Achromobacter mucicolens]|uniref:hypothetical protein n=1 Tax=Achromobacter mucicolens TaxID=1389922 RepID=UPI0015831CC2|nr:hypothetical protein [Achromobacter mucicolens]
MAKLVYRVVSACGALGYGFSRESLQKALEGRIDAVISDAGSMDAGPYYLGTGTEYFEREAVKADFRHMVEAGERIDGPVILGSCGMAGGNRNLDWMIDVAKEVFDELGVKDRTVAVIRSELDPASVIREFRAGALRSTGADPELDAAALEESTIVGQMGVHPLITALEGGAKYVLAGRWRWFAPSTASPRRTRTSSRTACSRSRISASTARRGRKADPPGRGMRTSASRATRATWTIARCP